MGQIYLKQPEVAKPLLLHQNFLFHLIRISKMIKHTHLTTEHSELPEEGFTFKMQWKYWSYSWDLLLATLTSVDVHKKEVSSPFLVVYSQKMRKEAYSTWLLHEVTPL